LNFPSSTSQPFHSFTEPSLKNNPTFPSSHQLSFKYTQPFHFCSLNFSPNISILGPFICKFFKIAIFKFSIDCRYRTKYFWPMYKYRMSFTCKS